MLVFSPIIGFIKLVGRRLMSLPGVQNIFEMESFESTILDFVCEQGFEAQVKDKWFAELFWVREF